MASGGYDVWLRAIDEHAREAAPQALGRVFGIDVSLAARLLTGLPRAVKRDTTEAEALRIVAALESIGARADCVARPLKAVPVIVVGVAAQTPEPAPLSLPPPPLLAATAVFEDHPVPDVLSVLQQKSTGQTLSLGTQALEALQPYLSMAPNTAAPRPMSSPPASAQTLVSSPLSLPAADLPLALSAPTPAVSVESSPAVPMAVAPIELPDPDARSEAFEVEHDRAQWQVPPQPFVLPMAAAGLTLDPRQLGALELGSVPPIRPVRHAFALPPSIPPSMPPSAASPATRPATERARLPRRQVASQTSSRAPAMALRDSLDVSAKILQEARRSSWKDALRGHHVAGFLLVLGSTAAVFLVLLALI